MKIKLLFRWLWEQYKGDKQRNRAIKKMRIRQKQGREAMNLADLRAKASNKKQWVLVVDDGSLQVVNREEIKIMQRNGNINKDLEGYQLDDKAFYVAQISNNKYIHPDRNKPNETAKAIIEVGNDAEKFLRNAGRALRNIPAAFNRIGKPK